MFKKIGKTIMLAAVPFMIATGNAHAVMGNFTIDFSYSNLHTSDGSTGPSSVTGHFQFTAMTPTSAAGWYYLNLNNYSAEIDGVAALLDPGNNTARIFVEDNGNISIFDYRSWDTSFGDGDFQFTFFGNNIVSWISDDSPACSNTVNGLRYQLDGVRYDTCGGVEISYEHQMIPIKPSANPLAPAPTPADFPTPTEVPAPAGLALLGLGLLGCLQTRRMRKAA